MLLCDFPQPKSPDPDTSLFSRGINTNPPDPDLPGVLSVHQAAPARDPSLPGTPWFACPLEASLAGARRASRYSRPAAASALVRIRRAGAAILGMRINPRPSGS
jgi:hypothetical protein